MKKVVIILMLALFQNTLKAQFIKGIVLESDTDKPIVGASIYFDGMSGATMSNNTGNFILNTRGISKIPITISYLGYYSEKIDNYSEGKELRIYLKPKVFQLDEVGISVDDGMSREEKMALFKKEFLGISSNASNCEITNQDEIRLSYNKTTKTLKAFSDNPLKIINKNLGYRLTYFLDNFSTTGQEFSIHGNFFFEEDTLIKAIYHEVIANRRENSFLESRTYFIRSLWNNTLDKDGFRIEVREGTPPQTKKIGYYEMIVANDSSKYIKVGKTYKIISKNNKVSSMGVNDQDVYINKNGFYSLGPYWKGDMAIQRIGDLLPYEYQPPVHPEPLKLKRR